MTTETNTTSALEPGQHVTLTGGRLPYHVTGSGRVVAIGDCGYGRCPHGEDCVTVRWPGHSTTSNYPSAGLAREYELDVETVAGIVVFAENRLTALVDAGCELGVASGAACIQTARDILNGSSPVTGPAGPIAAMWALKALEHLDGVYAAHTGSLARRIAEDGRHPMTGTLAARYGF